jgi:hypothetical protein
VADCLFTARVDLGWLRGTTTKTTTQPEYIVNKCIFPLQLFVIVEKNKCANWRSVSPIVAHPWRGRKELPSTVGSHYDTSPSLAAPYILPSPPSLCFLLFSPPRQLSVRVDLLSVYHIYHNISHQLSLIISFPAQLRTADSLSDKQLTRIIMSVQTVSLTPFQDQKPGT